MPNQSLTRNLMKSTQEKRSYHFLNGVKEAIRQPQNILGNDVKNDNKYEQMLPSGKRRRRKH